MKVSSASTFRLSFEAYRRRARAETDAASGRRSSDGRRTELRGQQSATLRFTSGSEKTSWVCGRWGADELGARLAVTAGVRHVAQPRDAPAAIAAALDAYDGPLQVAALSVMMTLTGSALLALAVARGFLSAEAAWRAAHVNEDFQAERWGVDAEAMARREARSREFEVSATAVALTRAA